MFNQPTQIMNGGTTSFRHHQLSGPAFPGPGDDSQRASCCHVSVRNSAVRPSGRPQYCWTTNDLFAVRLIISIIIIIIIIVVVVIIIIIMFIFIFIFMSLIFVSLSIYIYTPSMCTLVCTYVHGPRLVCTYVHGPRRLAFNSFQAGSSLTSGSPPNIERISVPPRHRNLKVEGVVL